MQGALDDWPSLAYLQASAGASTFQLLHLLIVCHTMQQLQQAKDDHAHLDRLLTMQISYSF